MALSPCGCNEIPINPCDLCGCANPDVVCTLPNYTNTNCPNGVSTTDCTLYTGDTDDCVSLVKGVDTNTSVITKLINYIKNFRNRILNTDNSLTLTNVTDLCEDKLNIKVKIDVNPLNKLLLSSAGLYVAPLAIPAPFTLNILDTSSLDLSGNGSILNPLKGDIKIDPITSNALVLNTNGLFSAKINIASTECLTFTSSIVGGIKTYTPIIDYNCIANQICGLCPVPPICFPVNFDNISIIPDAIVGVTYNYDRRIDGTGPFTIVKALSNPSWLNIDIVGNMLQFRGLPTSANLGTNISVLVGVKNDCGFSSLNTKTNVISTIVPCTFIAAPILNMNSALNVNCPYNLNNVAPSVATGFTLEWHTANNIDSNTLVENPASAIAGTYYAFIIQDGTRCSSASSSFNLTCALIPICMPVDFLFVPEIPNAIVGQPYIFNRILTGTGPFYLTGIDKPSWMTIILVGNVLQFTGTPLSLDVTSGVNVSYLANNACGSRGDSRFITVSNPTPVCNNVQYLGGVQPIIPNAVVGVNYNTVINLTGTPQFAKSNVIIPSWMTITDVGNGYQLSGIPLVSGAITIAFTITNCVAGSISFSQSINIVTPPIVCKSYTLINTDPNRYTITYRYDMCTGGTTSTRSLVSDGEISFCAIEGSVQISGGNPTLTDNGPCAIAPPSSTTFKYGFTEANTLGTLMESEYVASVDAVFALNQELTGSFTPGGLISVPNFGNNGVDKVFFIQVPPGEAAFTLWSELNSLQTNRPIDQVFNLGNNVWFKSTRSGGTLYITKIQTTFTNAVTLQR